MTLNYVKGVRILPVHQHGNSPNIEENKAKFYVQEDAAKRKIVFQIEIDPIGDSREEKNDP